MRPGVNSHLHKVENKSRADHAEAGYEEGYGDLYRDGEVGLEGLPVVDLALGDEVGQPARAALLEQARRVLAARQPLLPVRLVDVLEGRRAARAARAAQQARVGEGERDVGADVRLGAGAGPAPRRRHARYLRQLRHRALLLLLSQLLLPLLSLLILL